MKTILVPVDYSKNSDNACKYAIEIAKAYNSKIILLHTFETPVVYSDAAMITTQLDYSVLYNSALKDLKSYQSRITKIAGKIAIEMILQQGLASARINEIALEKKVDLIVMGTTGKGALERALIGSNTSRIIRKAPCLVLAVPQRAKYSGFKKIVFATDLHHENLIHSKILLPFAKRFNSELLVLNVNTSVLSGNSVDDMKATTKKIKEYVKYPKTAAYVCNDANVADGINFFLKKHKPDCLAMFTHHRNAFENIYNSSITKEMAVHAKVPLLVIHENDLPDDL